MTRKRYVKLLMGLGYRRNCANYFADSVLRRGKTYRKDYDVKKLILRRFYSSPDWAAIKTRYLGRWNIGPEVEKE